MSNRVYLDWNATAPLRPEARAAMLAALDASGNPSSVHGAGRVARQIIEHARGAVAALCGADPRNVVFTSGGTEANALALSPGWVSARDGRPCDRLIVSVIEHASVTSGGRFPTSTMAPVTEAGCIDLGALETALVAAARDGGRLLVSIMLANNETGVVQPVRAAAEIVHAAGGLLHVDAVQAAGRIPIDINALGADLLTVSAHKIGGPQGAGALIRRDAELHLPNPLITGGGQERGLRAGTENVAAIAGFGAAATTVRLRLAAEAEHMRALCGRLEQGLRGIAPESVIFGERAERVPNTVLFAVPGIKAETALIALDLDGVAVSSGAACSSGKVAPSHVLAAMGVERTLATGAIRVSFGWATRETDIDRFLRAWRTCIAALGKRRAELAA